MVSSLEGHTEHAAVVVHDLMGSLRLLQIEAPGRHETSSCPHLSAGSRTQPGRHVCLHAVEGPDFLKRDQVGLKRVKMLQNMTRLVVCPSQVVAVQRQRCGQVIGGRHRQWQR